MQEKVILIDMLSTYCSYLSGKRQTKESFMDMSIRNVQLHILQNILCKLLTECMMKKL
jgi:hypothetical protein